MLLGQCSFEEHFVTPIQPFVYGSPFELGGHSHLNVPSKFMQMADAPQGPFGSIGSKDVHSFTSEQPILGSPEQPGLH